MTLPQKIGKYEIEGVLGSGGMSTVYVGYDRAIARKVAIKAIGKATLESSGVRHLAQRFRHEAQAVGRLAHPHIVQIYDYGEDDACAYIVMELIRGKTLQDHLLQEESYELHEVGEIVTQLLDGIGHAHSAQVIHRDLKPSNIMINSDGILKISDFGIARIEASELTKIGDVLGTLHYMAPEQFLGLEVDGLADLFSVGVIAYELATGKKPFFGSSATVMQQVLSQRPVNPSQLNPKLSPLIDEVLHKALAKQRDDRFQSAREFSLALRKAIDATLHPEPSVVLQAAALIQPLPSAPAALLQAAPAVPWPLSHAVPLPAAPATPLHPAAPAVPLQPVAPALPDISSLLDAARLIEVRAAPEPIAETTPPELVPEGAISVNTDIKKAHLLMVDDEERILSALHGLFRDRYHVFATTDPNKALDLMRNHQIHVIVSDQRMPGMLGVDLLRQSRTISPNSVRILLTGYADLAAIVGSINEGEVYRFISKPWDNTDLQALVAEAATIALELADTKLAPTELPPQLDAGVLVLGDDEDIFRVVRELVAARCAVVYAYDTEAALATMRSQQIAVLVIDAAREADALISMINELKNESAPLITIVVTTASDAHLVIELINKAQIFRLVSKPVDVKKLKAHLMDALVAYLAAKEQSESLASSADSAPPSLGRRLSNGLRALGKRLGFGRNDQS